MSMIGIRSDCGPDVGQIGDASGAAQHFAESQPEISRVICLKDLQTLCASIAGPVKRRVVVPRRAASKCETRVPTIRDANRVGGSFGDPAMVRNKCCFYRGYQ